MRLFATILLGTLYSTGMLAAEDLQISRDGVNLHLIGYNQCQSQEKSYQLSDHAVFHAQGRSWYRDPLTKEWVTFYCFFLEGKPMGMVARADAASIWKIHGLDPR